MNDITSTSKERKIKELPLSSTETVFMDVSQLLPSYKKKEEVKSINECSSKNTK